MTQPLGEILRTASWKTLAGDPAAEERGSWVVEHPEIGVDGVLSVADPDAAGAAAAELYAGLTSDGEVVGHIEVDTARRIIAAYGMPPMAQPAAGDPADDEEIVDGSGRSTAAAEESFRRTISTGLTAGTELVYPDPGSAIPGQPGYVVGRCEHRVARSEWAAGLRVCERCPDALADLDDLDDDDDFAADDAAAYDAAAYGIPPAAKQAVPLGSVLATAGVGGPWRAVLRDLDGTTYDDVPAALGSGVDLEVGVIRGSDPRAGQAGYGDRDVLYMYSDLCGDLYGDEDLVARHEQALRVAAALNAHVVDLSSTLGPVDDLGDAAQMVVSPAAREDAPAASPAAHPLLADIPLGPIEREPVGPVHSSAEDLERLTAALRGVQLGVDDRGCAAWLARTLDAPTMRVMLSWLERVRAAGRAEAATQAPVVDSAISAMLRLADGDVPSPSSVDLNFHDQGPELVRTWAGLLGLPEPSYGDVVDLPGHLLYRTLKSNGCLGDAKAMVVGYIDLVDDPTGLEGTGWLDEVWIATHRRGVTAHRPDGDDRTVCGRSTRTGDRTTARQATDQHGASFCAKCWPAGSPLAASAGDGAA